MDLRQNRNAGTKYINTITVVRYYLYLIFNYRIDSIWAINHVIAKKIPKYMLSLSFVKVISGAGEWVGGGGGVCASLP